jgi:hypothetical protein
MHYRNGREAKNGDKVLLQKYDGAFVCGILYDATPGNDHCNGKLAIIYTGDPCPDLKSCVHLEDARVALHAAGLADLKVGG